MESKLIDITKPVQTRDGQPVTQLVNFNTSSTKYNLYGVVNNSFVAAWLATGEFSLGSVHPLDLQNVPEKKIVPLEFGDIMPGDLFKWEMRDSIYMVSLVSPDEVFFQAASSIVKYCYNGLTNAQYSQDRGKTWKPCFKEI